jgi:hypothetical protein
MPTIHSTESDGRGVPRLVKLNTDLARNLSLDPDTLPSPEGVEILARNHMAAGFEPVMLGQPLGAPTTRAPAGVTAGNKCSAKPCIGISTERQRD